MTICIHDVLQNSHFSTSQIEKLKEQSMFSWFKECVVRLGEQNYKMVALADDLTNKDWVDLVKDMGWEVQCHGLFHHNMKYLTEEQAYIELAQAKLLLSDTFNQKITQFYPPYLKWSYNLFKACQRLGMTMMMERDTPLNALNENKVVPEVYIHYWQRKNVDDMLTYISKLKGN